MPAQSAAWYESGPAFEVLDPADSRVVGRYPAAADKVRQAGRRRRDRSGRPIEGVAASYGDPLRPTGIGAAAAHGEHQGAVRERMGVRIPETVAARAPRR